MAKKPVPSKVDAVSAVERRKHLEEVAAHAVLMEAAAKTAAEKVAKHAADVKEHAERVAAHEVEVKAHADRVAEHAQKVKDGVVKTESWWK